MTPEFHRPLSPHQPLRSALTPSAPFRRTQLQAKKSSPAIAPSQLLWLLLDLLQVAAWTEEWSGNASNWRNLWTADLWTIWTKNDEPRARIFYVERKSSRTKLRFVKNFNPWVTVIALPLLQVFLGQSLAVGREMPVMRGFLSVHRSPSLISKRQQGKHFMVIRLSLFDFLAALKRGVSYKL